MKRIVFMLMLVCPMAASARTELRPMLKEGKTWNYVYHHFEENAFPTSDESYNESVWRVAYNLRGDTVIGGRQYMKMYRWDEMTQKRNYYGAFREDEEGRVWQYDYEGDKKDFMLCDVTLNAHIQEDVNPIADVINIFEQRLHRYHWNGIIGVEGVGLKGKGLVHYLYEPEPDCLCDYESFESVTNDIYFTAQDFDAPKYIELTSDEKKLVEKSNDFTLRLFRKLHGEKSLILSPLSIAYALGMANNGAAGQTQQEICEVLGGHDTATHNAFCLKIIDELATAGMIDRATKVLISNTFFVNQGRGWELQPDFIHAANQYYYAYPSARDFSDGKTRDAINQWASDHTEGMVKEVLSEEEFKPEAVSYLLNAIYFKGMWSVPFKAENTQEELFEGGDNVPMMHRTQAELEYAENDLCQAVRLPYGNGTYRLQIFLPRESKTLDEMLENLNTKDWQMNFSNYDVDLKLPRFETETQQNLKEVMAELGMPSAFSPTEADFSRLCINNHGMNIYIDLMKQVAKIKLDEQGTEAAAVTIIGYDGTGITPSATFHAKRPFLYTISEQSTGLILFMGQYLGEKASSVDSPLTEPASDDNRIYNLSGQQLSAPPSHGLYIRNGKKMMRR